MNKRFSLTALQDAYFTGRKSSSGKTVMREKESYELFCEQFNSEKFENAVAKLIQTHPMLRCTIHDDRTQEISDCRSAPIQYIYVKNEIQRKEKLEELKNHFFDEDTCFPDDCPISFTVIVDEGGNASVITLTDGMVFDGESQQIFIRDLDTAYGGGELPKDVGFAEYLEAVEMFSDSDDYSEAETFWQDRIQNIYDPPQIFCDEEVSDNYFQISRKLPVEFFSGSAACAKASGVTQFALLLALYIKTLEKYCAEKSFSLNLPIFNRLPFIEGTENLIGMCADFTVFNHEHMHEESLLMLARRVQKQLAVLFDNRQYSGTDILKSCSKFRGENFQVPYTFTVLTENTTNLNYFKKKSFIAQTADIRLETIIQSFDDGVLLTMTGNGKYILQDTAAGIADVFVQAAESMISDKAFIEKRSSLRVSDRDAVIIHTANDTLRDNFDISLGEVLQKSFEKSPNKVALATQSRTVTYGELKILIGRLQKAIRDFETDDPLTVGILLSKGLWQIISELACACGGYVFLPLETEQPVDSLAYCIENTKINVLISENSFMDSAKQLDVKYVINIDELENSENIPVVYRYLKPNDIVMMINTSGSTGRPKSILIKHEGLMSCLKHTARIFDITDNDTSIEVTNYCHDMSIFDILCMVAYHGTVAVPEAYEEKEPGKWISLMNTYGVTVWNSVPAFFEMLLASEEDGLENAIAGLKRIMLGGDWIKPSLLKQIRKINSTVRIFSVGGPSETTIWNIYHEVLPEDMEKNFIPYGKPFPNTKYHILDENNEQCPILAKGTMFVSGVGVAAGYAGLQEETEKRFLNVDGERMYNTGDLGVYLTDGSIRILGRDDFQVKVNGKRIEPSGIENIVNRFDGITGCVVVFHKKLSSLVGYYTCNKPIDKTLLESFLKNELPFYMVPAQMVELQEIPLTQNAKPNRKKLISMELDFNKTESSNEQKENFGENSLKNFLFNMCKEILGNTRISPDDNFYYMGGDSISAMKLVAEIRKQFNVSLEVYDILNNPFLNDWVLMIEELKNKKENENDEVEYRIKEICGMLFPGVDIDQHNNLFSMGGNEISAKMLVGAINSSFHMNMNVYDILSNPFIVDWIELVKER